MASTDETVGLSISEAACLDAVKRGFGTKTPIAVASSRDLKTVANALETLRRARLVRRYRDACWRVTSRGRHCLVRQVPDPESKRGSRKDGKIVPGTAADRLFGVLERPMRGADLVPLLGVSPQRVRQIVVRLLAHDKAKTGDPEHVLQIVARSDDPSVLLTRDEERVLTALPDDAATLATGLVAITHMSVTRVLDVLAKLRKLGLVENAGTRRSKARYRLSPAGEDHFQRRNGARRAKPVALVVRSDRVREVLACLSERGEARIKDLRDALGIAQASMNALMQYLKRKNLVKKVGDKQIAPYRLTDEGREALDEMIRFAGEFSS